MIRFTRETKEFIDQALLRWSNDAEKSIKDCEEVKDNPLYKAVLDNLNGVVEKAEKLGELLDLNLYAFTDEELEEINLYGKHYLKMEEI